MNAGRLFLTIVVAFIYDAPKIPAGALAAEDAELVANLAPQGKLRMRLVLPPQQLPDVDSFNVALRKPSVQNLNTSVRT